ncbi:hypothetical protein J7M23_09240 [Candidatus Sumerlaeota bacterium]|nr:hypothetical protein [Candidatus Sumerlaeota bacterium]
MYPGLNKTERIKLYVGFFVPFIILVAHCSYYLGWTIDDPYISYRYAENLANGKGLVFNPGEQVEGYSNFLFTLILAGFNFLGISPVWLSRLIGFCSALALIWVMFHALDKELFSPSALPLIRFFPLYLIALNGSLALWSVSGLETGFYTLLVALAWLLLIREDHAKASPLIVSCVFLLVALSRHEGALFFIVCFAGDIWRTAKNKDSILLRRLILRAIPIGVLFALYNLWRISYYHSLLPNTFYAKATGDFSTRISEGVVYLFRFVLNNGNLLYLLVLFPILSQLRLKPSVIRSLEFIIAGLIFVIYSGGDWMPLWRFLCPIMPMLFYIMGLGLAEFWRRVKTRDIQLRRRDFAILMVIVLLAIGVYQERRLTFPIMSSVREGSFYRPNILAGLWLKFNADPSAKVAGEEAGIIGYYSQRYFIDMVGIVEPHIARIPGALHQKSDPQYILRQKPTYIILICKPFYPKKNAHNPSPLTSQIEAIFTTGKQILAQQEFQAHYKAVARFPRGNELIGRSDIVIFSNTRLIKNKSAQP